MARVLVVDDERFVRVLIRRVLEARGHSVIEASSGGDAMQLLAEEEVELVLTDILMPGTDGLETLIAIRKQRPQLGVVVVSGGGEIEVDSYFRMCKALGAVRTLAKPFASHELVAVVEEALSVKAA